MFSSERSYDKVLIDVTFKFHVPLFVSFLKKLLLFRWQIFSNGRPAILTNTFVHCDKKLFVLSQLEKKINRQVIFPPIISIQTRFIPYSLTGRTSPTKKVT